MCFNSELHNFQSAKYSAGVSLEAGNRQKPPPTLSLIAAYFLQISLTWLKKINPVAAYFS